MARGLYGGAITAEVPDRFVDVSQFRDIPDNQEVLCDIDTDQSVIVELLSLVEDVSDESCAEFHFNEIVKENDAQENVTVITNRVLTDEELPNISGANIHKAMILGRMHASKFKESATNLIELHMAIIRIPKITTDILISFNAPVIINEESSSAKNVQDTTPPQESPAILFQNVLKTFTIQDWGLFGADN